MNEMMNRAGCQNGSRPGKMDPIFGMPVGMGYVPWQSWGKVYPAAEGLRCGTIFPPLELPFYGCIPKGYRCGKGGRA